MSASSGRTTSGTREHALPRQDLGVLDALRELALVLRREQLVLGQLTEVRGEVIVGVRRTHRLRSGRAASSTAAPSAIGFTSDGSGRLASHRRGADARF